MRIIRDHSTFRVRWDLFLLVLILLSAVLIPYQIAFQHTIALNSSAIIYAIDLIFLLDIYFNFHTTYRKKGEEVNDKPRIIRHYSRTWLPVDLICNIPFDLIILLLAPEATFLNISLILLFRLPRLLRVARLFYILRKWKQQTWSNSGFLRITHFSLTISLLIHWIACIWFLIPYISGFPPESWAVNSDIVSASSGEQYIRSLYWTITTMTTVGYGDITPQNTAEYIITMIVMLLGASLYAFIIGNIASLFSNLDAAKAQHWSRIEGVTQFLQSRNVPHEMSAKVRDYYEYMWARHKGISEDEMLLDLPAPLRLEVLLHLTKELLEKVPLFKYCPPSLRNILLDALIPQTYPPNMIVAQKNEYGKEIFFISKGKLEVITEENEKRHTILEEGDYFGNITLLLKEKRTASVRTLTYCEIFILENKDFSRIRNEYPEFKATIKKMSAEKSEKTTALILEGIIL